MANRFADLGVILVAALGWATLAHVVTAVPVSVAAQAVFYLTLFVALSSTAALAMRLYYWRRPRLIGGEENAARHLATGARFALAAEFALWLQSLRVLSAAYLLLIVTAFFAVEYLLREAGRRAR